MEEVGVGALTSVLGVGGDRGDEVLGGDDKVVLQAHQSASASLG